MPKKKEFILAAILVCVITGFAISIVVRTPQTYLKFIAKDRNYYSQVADACEQVRTQTLAGTITGRMRGDDPTLPKLARYARAEFALRGDNADLPAILAKLRPDFILVRSNSMTVNVPHMRGWGVLWGQISDDPSKWYLKAGGEGVSETLLWRTNSATSPK